MVFDRRPRIGDKAAKISAADIHFDANAPLPVFPANLCWTFFFDNIGELTQRNEMTFRISHLEVTNCVDAGTLAFLKTDLHRKTPMTVDNLPNNLASYRLHGVEHIRRAQSMSSDGVAPDMNAKVGQARHAFGPHIGGAGNSLNDRCGLFRFLTQNVQVVAVQFGRNIGADSCFHEFLHSHLDWLREAVGCTRRFLLKPRLHRSDEFFFRFLRRPLR